MKSPIKVELLKNLQKDFKNFDNTILYTIELSYDNQFEVTTSTNPHHIQIKYEGAPFFHKENLINKVIKHLPVDWKYLCWIDSDITIKDPLWSEKTISALNHSYPIIMQPWSIALDNNQEGKTLYIQKSFCRNTPFGHTGYVWALNRLAFNKIGYIYDKAIIGSADLIISYALINKPIESTHGDLMTKELIEDIKNYSSRFQNIVMGYIDSTIVHNYHGDKRNRQYYSRWNILKEYKTSDLIYENDILIAPEYLRNGLIKYFHSRKEI